MMRLIIFQDNQKSPNKKKCDKMNETMQNVLERNIKICIKIYSSQQVFINIGFVANAQFC